MTALFVSLVMLAMLGCRQPARRIVLARLALLASLAIPLASLGPQPRLDLVDLVIRSELIPLRLWVAPDSSQSPPASSEGRVARDPPGWLPSPMVETGSGLRRGWVYFRWAGVGAGLGWLLLGFGGVQWIIHRAHAPSLATTQLYEQLLAGSTAPGRTILRVSSRLQHPVVVGLLRPTILIPTSLDQPDGEGEGLRLSLLHELAHLERSDHWFGTAANLAQTVWFFLPPVWWLRSQLRIDQEFLADRSAARRYGSAFGYASSLLSMAARPGAPVDCSGGNPGSCGRMTGARKNPSPLVQRVLMLLHCPFPVEAHTPRLWSWTSKLTVLGAALVAACLVIRWPDTAAVQQRTRPPRSAASPMLRIAHFLAEPQHSSAGSRSLPSVLPLALPAGFELRVEVRSTAAQLAQIRLAGLPLGCPRLDAPGPFHEAPTRVSPVKSWHQVRLRRGPEGVALEIDGRAVPVDSGSEPLSDWLTIEPGPREPVEFRNLTVAG